MWSVELEPEVEEWLDDLSSTEFGIALAHVDRLAERGNLLRMPASRSLGQGLFELRFDMGRSAWRITYFFAADRRIVFVDGVPQAASERAGRGSAGSGSEGALCGRRAYG